VSIIKKSNLDELCRVADFCFDGFEHFAGFVHGENEFEVFRKSLGEPVARLAAKISHLVDAVDDYDERSARTGRRQQLRQNLSVRRHILKPSNFQFENASQLNNEEFVEDMHQKKVNFLSLGVRHFY